MKKSFLISRASNYVSLYSFVCHSSTISHQYKPNLRTKLLIRWYSLLSSSNKTSHYDVLGLTPAANSADIKMRYFELAKLYHPDTNRIKSPEERHKAQKQYSRIKEAYEVLGNKKSRKLFDSELQKNNGSSTSIFQAGKNARTTQHNKYYGQAKYSGSHHAASSFHRKSRAQTYYHYNKHHEYSSPDVNKKNDTNPLNFGYKSGSNYDVPHFDFDKHYKQQRSYEIHRKRSQMREQEQSILSKKSSENGQNIFHGKNDKHTFSSDSGFIYNEYDMRYNYNPYTKGPKPAITFSTTEIIALTIGTLSSIYFIIKLLF